MRKSGLIFFLFFLITANLVFATAPCRIPFQASGFKLANGTLIPSASVSTYVYVDPSGGIPIYSETWASGLQNGYISVTMGNDTSGNPLNLNWGQTYWLAVNINGTPITMVDSYGVSAQRQAFISTQGEIVQLTQVNESIVAQSSRIDILNSTIISLNNLSLINISDNIGNYSQDKAAIYTNWTSLGNYSQDKAKIYTNFTSIGNYSAERTAIYLNLTDLQTSNTTTNNRITSVNNTLNTLIVNVSTIGNWTADKPSYSTLTETATNIGNWTFDKPNYALISWVLGYLSGMNNLSLSDIVGNIGNWTLDKPNYATIAYVNTLGNFSAENSTLVRNGTKTCSDGQVLQNVTGNSSGFYGDCVVATSSTGFRINASIGMYFNKTLTTYNGSLTNGSLVGYLAGHAICNYTFLGTHFCSQEEIIETMWHANITTMTTWTGNAWASSGAPKYAPASTPVNDCNGWTSAVAASYLGNYWAFSTTGGGTGATINCGTYLSLACCGVG